MSDIQLPATIEPDARREPLIPIGYVIAGAVITLIVGALSVVLLVYLANNYADTILVVRDIFIIALGLMSCLSGIVLILLLIAVTRLVNICLLYTSRCV